MAAFQHALLLLLLHSWLLFKDFPTADLFTYIFPGCLYKFSLLPEISDAQHRIRSSFVFVFIVIHVLERRGQCPGMPRPSTLRPFTFLLLNYCDFALHDLNKELCPLSVRTAPALTLPLAQITSPLLR